MTLPDAVLAFKLTLLDTACLDEKNRQLALTACAELKFSSMKSALKRIFGGKSTGSSSGIQVNQDVAFFKRPQGRGKRNVTFQSGQLKQPLPGTNPRINTVKDPDVLFASAHSTRPKTVHTRKLNK